MEVKQVLRMNGGNGETSYANNSQLQNKMISQTRPITEAAIVDFYRTTFSHSISIADLGCSSGPNTLMFVWEIIEAIQKVCSILGRPLPELRFFLNDLPGNDFNTIFKSLPEFHMKLMNVKGIDYGECFIAGVPGTFYGRLFPSKSLDFVHSSSSLHWLSRVPPELDSEADTPLNKGKIYISKTSPSCVLNAYLVQFQKDFSLFLKSRSKEVVAGGRMVLSFLGRLSADPTTEESCHQWELLARALNEMVLERLIHDKLKRCGALPSRQLWREMLLMPPSPPPPPRAPELVSFSSNPEAVINTLSVVTTLVATVTFAAAFTVPGGYKNDGVQEGLPVFIKTAALITFLFSDTLAFCSSIAATILLVYASANPTDKYLSSSALNTCAYISAVAIPATLTAFMTGIYVLTSKESLGLAVTSILLGCSVPIFVIWRVKHMKRRAQTKNQQRKESENVTKAREDVPMGPSSPAPPNVDHMKSRAEKKNQQSKESEISREAHEDVLENYRGAREDVPMGPSSPAPQNVDVPACGNLV